jgi:histidinol dehydrogenase
MALTGTDRLLQRVAWSSMDDAARRSWLDGLRAAPPEADVLSILDAVRRDGDAALRQYTERFDGARIEQLFVEEAAFEEAERSVDPVLREALGRAAAAVGRYHADQRNALRPRRDVRTQPGVTAWRRWLPLQRVGGYVPGGRAAYPSSVIMLGVPARLAGVGELLLATPPGPDGAINPAILVAARMAGVRRVLRVGGAQAIAALAYGTDSVPAVDKIFGAGNAWVTAAKRAVSPEVAIDLPAGPSECVVVADAGADARLVALDPLA